MLMNMNFTMGINDLFGKFAWMLENMPVKNYCLFCQLLILADTMMLAGHSLMISISLADSVLAWT